MRIALHHHWFVTRGGGERVAECIAQLFPSADIFTLVSSPEGLPRSLRNRRLTNSFLQKIGGASHHCHMVSLEAQACGRPIIACGKGGSLETVSGGTTGVYFAEQTADSPADAITRFEASEDTFQPEIIRQHAENFSTATFLRRYAEFVTAHVPDAVSSMASPDAALEALGAR